MVSGSLRATDSLLATTGVFDQSITITSQEAIPHLIFSRDHNYICFPSGGSVRITAGTTANARKNSPLIIEGTIDSSGITTDTNVYPGVSNKANLGLSSYKWANVYATTFTGDLSGNADSATKLATGRTLKVSLGSTAASTAFDGTANITDIGVDGTLGTGNGGTGNTSFTQWGIIYANPATKLVNTGAGTNGALLQGKGSAAPAWKASANGAVYATAANGDLQWGTLPIAQGGTGATTAQDATWNLLHVADPSNLNNAKRMGNFKISNTTTNTPVANMWGATWNIVDDAAAGNNGTSGSTWQLVFGSASTDMWLRSITNAGNWSDYAKFVTNKNYTDYTVTKTGSGASGTWGISITGNAATASEAQIVNSKNSNFDVKQTNNGGTNRYPTAFYIYDKNSLLVAYCQASILTSGDVNINLGARNWNTAGTTNVTNALTIGIAKDGTCSYGVSNAAAFRNAISAPSTTGSGASGSWGISITGDANTVDGSHATAFPLVFSASTGSTNAVIVTHASTGSDSGRGQCFAYGNANGAPWLTSIQYGYTYVRAISLSSRHQASVHFISATQFAIITQSWDHINVIANHGTVSSVATASADQAVASGDTNNYAWINGDSVTGAVWNDYAEYRASTCNEPGYCVFENGDDTLSKTTKRLQHFAGITSDTWGFAQGETETAKTPIAVSGRVLAYPYRDRNEYKPGDCVCAAPNGTVDIMTHDEVMLHPDKIVGTVSCVPTYEEWGGGADADRPSVKVDGRIWIKVK